MTEWIVFVALILTGLLAGLIFEKILLNRLKAIATKTHLPGNDILFKSLRGVTFILFVVAGLYFALLSLPLKPEISDVLQKVLTLIFLYPAPVDVTAQIVRVALDPAM